MSLLNGEKCPLGRFGRVISEVSAGERHSILSIEIMEALPKEMAWRPQIKSTLFICFTEWYYILLVCSIELLICEHVSFLLLFVTWFCLFTVFRDVLIDSDPMFYDHHIPHPSPWIPYGPMDPHPCHQELGSGRLELISCSGAGSNLGSLRFIQVGIPLEDLGSSGSWQVTKELAHLGSTLGFDDS